MRGDKGDGGSFTCIIFSPLQLSGLQEFFSFYINWNILGYLPCAGVFLSLHVYMHVDLKKTPAYASGEFFFAFSPTTPPPPLSLFQWSTLKEL